MVIFHECETMTIRKEYPLDEDKTKTYVVVNGKAGVWDKEGSYSIPPKYTAINRDMNGNYICEYYEHNKRIVEVYDSKFELKTSRTIED